MKKQREYQQFGNEWKKEIAKLPKASIIEMLKNASVENTVLKSTIEKLLSNSYDDTHAIIDKNS